ncbi:hypothetical protein B0H15DRAFT_801020 [Mycena belliarum]|uniref:C2H2-type domain-containing protein n=1 Tax=Mycena belliarum TaxID=1033014 RepID=A0AAD6U2B6_9AGAR|nr:hypothetical protein B0H15DRAFT_801020 [Mycena belliae]
MPRVARTLSSRSHKLPTGGKTPPSPPLHIRCTQPGCPWSFAKQYDLKRHLPQHMSPEDKAALMMHCTEPGCTYKTLQQSNMKTHMNAKHTGEKPHKCTVCPYASADPSSLYRHMLTIHPEDSGKESRSRPRKASASSTRSSAASSPGSDSLDGSSSAWNTPSPASSTDSLPYPLQYPSSPSADELIAQFFPTPPSTASSGDLPYDPAYPPSPPSDSSLSPDAFFSWSAGSSTPVGPSTPNSDVMWSTPSPASSGDLPYDPAYPPSAPFDSSFSPEASSSWSAGPSTPTSDVMWSPTFDDCGMMAATPSPTLALQYPAEHLPPFTSAYDDLPPLAAGCGPAHFLHDPAFEQPGFPYDAALESPPAPLFSSFELQPLLSPAPFLNEWSNALLNL